MWPVAIELHATDTAHDRVRHSDEAFPPRLRGRDLGAPGTMAAESVRKRLRGPPEQRRRASLKAARAALNVAVDPPRCCLGSVGRRSCDRRQTLVGGAQGCAVERKGGFMPVSFCLGSLVQRIEHLGAEAGAE